MQPPERVGGEARCPVCKLQTITAVFPAALRETFPPEPPEAAVGAQEAVCFYHAGAIVESHCDRCGRFLCRLCTLRTPQAVYCPLCLREEATRAPGPLLRGHYFRQDRLTLVLALLPFTIAWCVLPAVFLDAEFALGMFGGVVLAVSLVTAPMVLISVFRYWRKVEAPLGKPRRRLLLGGLLATAQAAVWVVAIVSLIGFALSRMGAD